MSFSSVFIFLFVFFYSFFLLFLPRHHYRYAHHSIMLHVSRVYLSSSKSLSLSPSSLDRVFFFCPGPVRSVATGVTRHGIEYRGCSKRIGPRPEKTPGTPDKPGTRPNLSQVYTSIYTSYLGFLFELVLLLLLPSDHT